MRTTEQLLANDLRNIADALESEACEVTEIDTEGVASNHAVTQSVSFEVEWYDRLTAPQESNE